MADRMALRLADVVLADTDENRDYFCSTFGVSAGRVVVVPVGADEAVFAPDVDIATSRACERTTGLLNVLFYGTMIPLQGVETIVRAASLLENDRVNFEIIGSGQTLASAQRLAWDLRVSNLEFVPRVPYEELTRRIADSDIVLGIFGATSKASRVVPNKVYQSMAMGAAIITRDSPASRRLLRSGESALLVPPADPDALAAAIQSLRDIELRRRLGEGARRRFEATATVEVQATLVRDAIDLLSVDPVAGNRAVSL
jgi:glycosyltransferase involved in cell wall biosynthesis